MAAGTVFFRWFSSKGRWWVWAFFTGFLLLGLAILPDYGISFDEGWARENGIINAKYILQYLFPKVVQRLNFCPLCPSLKDSIDVDHGPFFELIPTFLEWALTIEDLHTAYRVRHICSFLFFYAGAVFFYFLLQQRFRNYQVSLAGVFLLLLSPRIFADSFFNPRDIPFLSLTIICTYTLIKFLRAQNLKWAVWHALACSIAITIRIMGVVFPLLTFGLLLVIWLLAGLKAGNRNKKMVAGLAYLVSYAIFSVLFWPHLWEAPLQNFLLVLQRTSRYPWLGDVLYLGKVYPALKIPWHYLPVWFFSTTPVFISFAGITGLVALTIGFLRKGVKSFLQPKMQQDIAVASLFAGPFLGAVLLGLTLYDGWRHMFFMYPAFVYLAVLGMVKTVAFARKNPNRRFGLLLKALVICGFALNSICLAYWMVKNHPHQNVYFSLLKGPQVRQKFELDYYGLSYKQGLEFLLSCEKAEKIKVFVAVRPGYLNRFSFKPEQQKRLVYTKTLEEARYFLTEYRGHPQDFAGLKEMHKIEVDGYKIMSVYRVN